MATGRRLAQLAAEAAGAPTPADALRTVAELRLELEAFERSCVAEARAEGATFAAIARDLGLSRQAVHRRFRDVGPARRLETAPDLARVLRYAREEATALRSSDVHGEHILLAVLRARDLAAAEILADAGVTLERARAHVEAATPHTRLFRRAGADAEDLYTLLATPVDRARRAGSRTIEVEHVLLSLLEDPAGGAVRTLRALAVDPEALRARLEAVLESHAPR
jgi:ATP-dependent Clp protease ATP-binding subunit ClpA